MRRCALAIVALLAAGGCSKAGEESKARRSPVAPPPPQVQLPADLRIPVEVEGSEREPITAAELTDTEPDYVDEERRAWRLTALVEGFDRSGAVIEALGGAGVSVTMRRPDSAGDLQPVLFLTRRGDLVATIVDPDDPFPEFHGQGGRLRRPGDAQPRISPVRRLRVRHEPPK